MKIQKNISIKDFNTFKIECVARYFCIVKSAEDILFILDFVKDKNINYIFLGGGSNILFKTIKENNIYDGLVIRNEINYLNILEAEALEEKDFVKIEVGGGYGWDSFVKYCTESDYCGLENLSHIPGTVGAAPIQNIGAYGVEVKDVIQKVTCIDMLESAKQNKIIEKIFTNDAHTNECKFGYRDSIFKNEGKGKYFIKSVTFKLSKIKKLNLEYKDLQNYILENNLDSKNLILLQVRNMIISIRNSKMPNWREGNSLGTAGSFFKNIIISEIQYKKLLRRSFANKTEEELYKNIPAYKIEENKKVKAFYKLSSAYIIDKILGMKNIREGDVGTFENQALIIVNHGEARGQDVFDFSQKIIDECKNKTGLTLEREVNII